MEPEVVDLAGEVPEFKRVDVSLTFQNKSASEFTVARTVASCGCIRLVAEDGRPLEPPIRVEAGGILPFHVWLSTEGLNGERLYRVAFEGTCGEGGGEPVVASSSIQVKVLGGLRVAPDRIVVRDLLPGKEKTIPITVLDGHHDPGIPLREVRFSNPRLMHGRLRGLSAADEVLPDGAGFIPRYRLDLQYRFPEGEGPTEELIEFVPESPEYKSVQVPLICFGRPPRYQLSPQSLVFGGADCGKRFQRTVLCTLRDPDTPDLVVSEKPAFVEVRVSDAGDSRRRITVDCDLPPGQAGRTFHVVFAEGKTGGTAFNLPIVVQKAPVGDGPPAP